MIARQVRYQAGEDHDPLFSAFISHPYVPFALLT
jgi:hypothetical protein